MIDPTVLTGLVGAFAGGGIVGILIGRVEKRRKVRDSVRQRIDALKRLHLLGGPPWRV